MDDREQQRKIRHCLAVLRHAEEVSGNVATTCHIEHRRTRPYRPQTNTHTGQVPNWRRL